jgi:hypothetical protein
MKDMKNLGYSMTICPIYTKHDQGRAKIENPDHNMLKEGNE